MTRRLAAILALAIIPWTAIIVDGGVELVFLWGLVSTDPIHVVSIRAYLFELTRGLPDRLLAWPASTALYSAGAANGLAGRVIGREDRRLTAGVLALAGASHLVFAIGVGRRNPTTVALPLGTGLAWLVAWWYDWPVLAGAIRSER